MSINQSIYQSNQSCQPQRWTPLATFPHVVWHHIFEYLDRESMITIRRLMPKLDCYIPRIYSPTLQLDEVISLISRYVRPNVLLPLRQLNSFWRRCIDNFLDTQWSDERGEKLVGTPTPHLKFLSVADFQAFNDSFGLLDTYPVIHRRVLFKLPNPPEREGDFMQAIMGYMAKYGVHIWHVHIDGGGESGYDIPLGYRNIRPWMRLSHIPNMKSFYVNGVLGQEIGNNVNVYVRDGVMYVLMRS